MAERASVFQQVQVGAEATSGTGVAASKLLQSMDIQPDAQVNVDYFRPQGNKYPTVAALGKDFTTARVVGKPTYTELVYPFSGMFGAAVITGPNGDGAYTWVFNPASSAADAFKTFTVERGSAVQAEKFTYGLFDSLGMVFDRDRADLSGSMLGQAQTTGVTLTASPTALSLIPILPKQIDVYADATSGGLGTTKIGRLLQGNWSFGGKYSPLWVVDSSQASYIAVVEQTPNARFRMLVEADAAGMAFLATIRAGTTQYVRLKCSGPLIAGATSNSLTIDMAVKGTNPDAYEDSNGVYAIGLNWTLVHDGAWGTGKALIATIVNAIAAL
jgi:hypothetical protein